MVGKFTSTTGTAGIDAGPTPSFFGTGRGATSKPGAVTSGVSNSIVTEFDLDEMNALPAVMKVDDGNNHRFVSRVPV